MMNYCNSTFNRQQFHFRGWGKHVYGWNAWGENKNQENETSKQNYKTKINTELDREKWNIKTILSKQLTYSISEPIFYLRRGNTRREFIGT